MPRSPLRHPTRYAVLTSAALLPLLFFCLFCAVTAGAEDDPVSVTAVFTVPGIESPRGGAEYLTPVAQQAIQATADAILASLPPEDFVLTHRFQAINAIAGIATPAGMSALAAHPNVIAVDVQKDGKFFLAEAIPLASMPAVNTVSGGIIDGSGITVAVIDSGVDTAHPDLSGSIVGEACFCTGPPGCCPNGMATQTGTGSADDSVGHGTEVAGVIASAGGIAPPGGAPGASIVAISLAGTTGLSSFNPADLTAALDYVINSLPGVDTVNLSLGLTATYATDCDGADATTMAWASAIDTLAARGTVTIAASGNDAIGTGISPPACIANAISVGATYDAPQWSVSFPSCSDLDTVIDDVACFTNSASLLDLVAPGGEITTTGLWPSPGTASVFGTSFAAPAASACTALLQQISGLLSLPLTPSQVRSALRTSAITTTDAKNGLSFPRLDCLSATRATGATSPTFLVADRGGSIVSIDPSTGGQTLFASGGLLSEPVNLQFDGATRLLVTDWSAAASGALVRIDPTLSQEIVASEGFVVSPTAIAVEPSGDVLIGSGDVVRVDPDAYDAGTPSSNQTLVVSGGGMESVANFVRESSGSFLATILGTFLSPSVMRFDSAGTNLGAVAEYGHLSTPYGLARNSIGKLFVTDSVAHHVVRIDPDAFNPLLPFANQEIVASGGSLVDPRGIAAFGRLLFVADAGANAIIAIEPDAYDAGTPGSNQWVVSSGGLLTEPWGIVHQSVVISEDHLLVGDGGSNALFVLDEFGSPISWLSTPIPQIGGVATNSRNGIFVVDESTGNVAEMSWTGDVSSEIPNPTSFTGFAGIAVDDSDDIFIGDASSGAIFQMDASGTLLGTITSPEFSTLSGLANDDSAGFWVADPVMATIHRIDLSGVGVSSFAAPGALPKGLFYDWDNATLYIGDEVGPSIETTDETGVPTSSIPVPQDRIGGVAVIAVPEPGGVVSYPLSGNGGFWIGGGMPVPVTKGLPPNSAMQATPNATVMQTTGPDPVQMQIAPGQITKPFGTGYAGLFPNNPALFMVSTNLSAKFPAQAGVGNPPAPGTVTFAAGGRTGPATMTWCPGYATTVPCTDPSGGTIPGQLTYKATRAQFGGPGQASIGGKATVWVVAASPPPCKHTVFGGTNPNCFAVKGYASPAPLVAVGAPLGYANTTSPASASPNVYVVGANTTGTISLKVGVAQTVFKNTATSYGGPWTTGQLTIVQPTALGGSETFTITGSDARVAGIGNISLVAGGLSNRAVSGPNANRGWLILTVPEPGSTLSLAAGLALLALLKRRRRLCKGSAESSASR